MWSSVVVSVQLEKGDGSRSGMVTISCWPGLREPYSPPPCQAGCGAPWPGSAAPLPGEREKRGASEVLRWSSFSIRLPVRLNKADTTPVLRLLPPPARAVPPLQQTGRVYAGVSLKLTGNAENPLSAVHRDTSQIN